MVYTVVIKCTAGTLEYDGGGGGGGGGGGNKRKKHTKTSFSTDWAGDHSQVSTESK